MAGGGGMASGTGVGSRGSVGASGTCGGPRLGCRSSGGMGVGSLSGGLGASGSGKNGGGGTSSVWRGVYRRRKRRFLVVRRPDPSVLTEYWWYCSTSTTVPVLSHLVGWRPVWFWIKTVSPHLRGERPCVCSSHRVRPVTARLDSALSRRSSLSDHSAWGPGCRGVGRGWACRRGTLLVTSWSLDPVHSGTGGVPCGMRLRVCHWGRCYQ